MHKRRCVFKDYPDTNDVEFFEKIMVVIRSLAEDGVALELMSDETSQVTELHQMTWQSPDEVAELSIIRDFHDEICYASMSSKQSWISRRGRELFHATIPCYSIEELIQACSKRFFDAELLIALGLLGRKPDAEMIRTIAAALDHSSARVRYCAARAAGITQWSAFVPDLEMMLKMESDTNARQAAEHAFEVCSRLSQR